MERKFTGFDKTLLSVICVLSVGFSGCALSPQQVLLRPFIDVPAEPIGEGRTLTLTVIDGREKNAIGARGGVYDTAMITTRGNVVKPVYAALNERLVASGFVVVDGSEAPLDADLDGPQMNVEIHQIEYIVQADPLIPAPLLNEVHLAATVRASVRAADGTSRAGQYRVNSVRRQIGHPSEAENEEMINEVLAHALRQILLDAGIRAILARHVGL